MVPAINQDETSLFDSIVLIEWNWCTGTFSDPPPKDKSKANEAKEDKRNWADCTAGGLFTQQQDIRSLADRLKGGREDLCLQNTLTAEKKTQCLDSHILNGSVNLSHH